MSRYAHEHPEQFEPGGSGFGPLLDRAAQERIPRDPDGCLRCDGSLRGNLMFCPYCTTELSKKGQP